MEAYTEKVAILDSRNTLNTRQTLKTRLFEQLQKGQHIRLRTQRLRIDRIQITHQPIGNSAGLDITTGAV